VIPETTYHPTELELLKKYMFNFIPIH